MSATPPAWAERLLRAFLGSGAFDSVSGDLLEEYRDTVHPRLGQQEADAWYIRQVLGFAWRDARVWALLFGAAFVLRTALDWRVPPIDFHTRSTVSTAFGAAILAAAGLRASWRSGSCLAGTIAGVITTAAAALLSLLGAGALLAVWHDTQTMEAIRGSGGLGEVFFLPVLMMLPGVVVGTAAGVAGAALRKIHSRS